MFIMVLVAVWLTGYSICLACMTDITFKQSNMHSADFISNIVLSALLWPIILIPMLYEAYSSEENKNDNLESGWD